MKPKSSFVRLLQLSTPYLKLLIPIGACLILTAIFNPLMLSFLRAFIDLASSGNLVKLKYLTFLIILILLFNASITYIYMYLVAFLGQKVIIDLRNKIYSHLQFLSLSFYDRNKTGELMSHLTNDVAGVQTFISNGVIDFVSSSLKLIAIIFYIFTLNWRLASLCFIGVPLFSYAFFIYSKKIRKLSGKVQEKLSDLTDILQQTLSSTKIIKSFVREDYEINRFEEKNEETFSIALKTAKTTATLIPLVQLIAAFGLIASLWYGAVEITKARLTMGGLMTFIFAALLMSTPLSVLTRINTLIQYALACGDRIFKVLDEQSEIKEIPDAKILNNVKGKVEYKNVSFTYQSKEETLADINFSVNPGEVVALVGPSGAGKSTIVSLLPRFYDVNSGEILIDDLNIKEVTLNSLREQMGIVPQETILFSGTVKENIAYGNLKASKEQIIKAAKLANAHEFITGFPEGYETIVGERGVKLSGGERQRIAIARAILKNPKILILDEATSSLDSASEEKVQQALENLMRGRTTLIIAHRLSTVRKANKILVVAEGKIIEEGNHNELYQKGGLYYKLYNMQFKDLTIED